MVCNETKCGSQCQDSMNNLKKKKRKKGKQPTVSINDCKLYKNEATTNIKQHHHQSERATTATNNNNNKKMGTKALKIK